ncbi:hypothetical protein NDU88_003854 [Pleurodeles waltl]|uniref:Uncharacterized protein n=1 Tax=Pleurodeles waltl TaxID=8319 RepID=A0AAV7TQ85_PLEWA|nr:hypothetical protein NDU88_003854 [Pleurodeles waltl]
MIISAFVDYKTRLQTEIIITETLKHGNKEPYDRSAWGWGGSMGFDESHTTVPNTFQRNKRGLTTCIKDIRRDVTEKGERVDDLERTVGAQSEDH